MKIGVITFTEGINYGCKLQNYALIQSIKKIDPSADIFTINNNFSCGDVGIKAVKRKAKILIKNRRRFFLERKKQRTFDLYNDRYLNMTQSVFSKRNSKQFQDFDMFVCGSDQIWNPNYVPDISLNTACFMKNAKRVSYAASVGVPSIPDERKEEYYKCLSALDAVSVREEEAVPLLEELLKRKIYRVADPTLLLSNDEWTKFEKKPQNVPEKYVLTYFLTNINENMSEQISEDAKKTDTKVINLNCLEKEEWYSVSPNEFVYLIHHCEKFYTDSFHGTVFSILFKRDFLAFPRKMSSSVQDQKGRLETLLEIAGIKNRFISRDSAFQMTCIDYSGVDKKIEDEKNASFEYLKKAIRQDSNCITGHGENCCGCGACEAVCPIKAIRLELREGFLRPVVDRIRCIDCGMCKKVCQYCDASTGKSVASPEAFCVENRDDEIRLKSSSGGVFYLLAKNIIDQGGVVFCPSFDESFNLSHKMVDTLENLSLSLGSKYVQSNAVRSYSECKNELINGRQVLFSGTPCQIYALNKYLGRTYNNLITQDVICHGCASTDVFQKYLRYVTKREGKKVDKRDFRNKKSGWSAFSINITLEDGKEITERSNKNLFFSLFLRNYILRESCYSCPVRKMSRVSDITLADFWGIKEHDNMGTSLVLTHSQRGTDTLKSLQNETKRFEKVDFEKSISKNTAYNKDVEKPKDYQRFLTENKNDFKRLYRKYVDVNVLKKVYRKLFW